MYTFDPGRPHGVAAVIGFRASVLRVDDWDSADEILCRRVEGWMERGFELAIGAQAAPRIRETHRLQYDPSVGPHRFCRFVAERQ